MKLKTLMIPLALCAAAAAGGYGGGRAYLSLAEAKASPAKEVENEKVIVSAGQFTIPVFSDDGVNAVLLAQINIVARDYEQVRFLTRNRPWMRSMIIEALFALERRGEIDPGALDPQTLAASIKKDLERGLEIGEIGGVMFNRLLLQETGRAVSAGPGDTSIMR